MNKGSYVVNLQKDPQLCSCPSQNLFNRLEDKTIAYGFKVDIQGPLLAKKETYFIFERRSYYVTRVGLKPHISPAPVSPVWTLESLWCATMPDLKGDF